MMHVAISVFNLISLLSCTCASCCDKFLTMLFHHLSSVADILIPPLNFSPFYSLEQYHSLSSSLHSVLSSWNDTCTSGLSEAEKILFKLNTLKLVP